MRFTLALLTSLVFFPVVLLADPLATVESLDGKMKMEVLQLNRKNNVVTLKANISNIGEAKVEPNWEAEEFYLLNEEKGVKYFVLKDEDKRPVVSHFSYPGLGFKIEPHASLKIWAKFAAPQPEVKKINIVFENFDLLEGLAINDEG